MPLMDQINEELKTAMRAKDGLRLGAVRMLMAALKLKEKESQRSLKEDEVQRIVATLIKQRKEAAVQYREGNREDLAAQEEAEAAILQAFLPEQLSREELERLVDEAIAEAGATSAKDIGKVMKTVMPKTTGRADGKEVNELVRARLAG